MSANFTDEMELIAARIISASWTVLPNSLPLKKLNLLDLLCFNFLFFELSYTAARKQQLV
jgi:hypothetical protein